ncbi:hypothetical protein ES703_80333 [subsurface metagenome]
MRQSAMSETLISFFRLAVDSFRFSRASLGSRLTYSVTSDAAGRYRVEIAVESGDIKLKPLRAAESD